jgi:hypothetical protein
VKSRFWQYYPLEENDLDALSSQAVVALDANALLHAYRLTPRASEAWLDYLDSLAERIWVPHRAAFEYQRNRVEVVANQNRLATDIENDVAKALKALRNDVTRRQADIKRSRVFEWAEIDDALEHAGDSIRELIDNARAAALDLDAAAAASDPIHLRLTKLLEGRVGDAPEEDWCSRAAKEAAERFAKSVPPGWEDRNKEPVPGDEYRPFGDYFVWQQLLEYAESAGRPAILVTEDRKRDWVRKESGKTMGPLPELRAEFRSRVGHPFWLYTVAGFMSISNTLSFDLDPAAVSSALQLEEEGTSERADDVRSERRVGALLKSLERFKDQTEISDEDLRDEITELLAELLAEEFKALEKPLRGPGAGGRENADYS